MLRVAMETGARAYISIHCVSLPRRGTHSAAQLISGVFCSPLSQITAASFGVAGSGARRRRHRHRQGQANFPRQLNPACAQSSCQPPSCKVTRPIVSFPRGKVARGRMQFAVQALDLKDRNPPPVGEWENMKREGAWTDMKTPPKS